MGAFDKNTYTESFGGEGGDAFSDSPAVVKSGPITRIDLRYGAYLDAIQVTYGNSTGEHFGGHMGASAYYIVPEGHEIINVNLRAEAFIDGIQFVSIHPDHPDSLQESPWFGGKGGNYYSAHSPNGGPLREISGRAGAFIDQLNFTFLEPEVKEEAQKEPAPKGKKAAAANEKAAPKTRAKASSEKKPTSKPKATTKAKGAQTKATATSTKENTPKKSQASEKKAEPKKATPSNPGGKNLSPNNPAKNSEKETPTKKTPAQTPKKSPASKTKPKSPAKKPAPATKASSAQGTKKTPPQKAISTNPPAKKSYYRTIKGVKYDRTLLETAQSSVERPGDGRISKVDAEKIWKEANDGPGLTTVEKRTLEYILGNFNVTPAARKWLKEQMAAAT